jgi:MFS transporter, DHA1 family, multidrug resistance protein
MDDMMKKIGQSEFIALMASLTAMIAGSIDVMLPALGVIARDLNVANPNDQQLIIFGFFMGLSFGMLIFGPISDAIGRKPTIFGGLAIYIIGSLICLFANSFSVLIVGRVIQGFGAASPRVVSIAMVRDGAAGDAMARIMSFVMSVFMVVPVIAPSIGVLVLEFAHWRWMFAGLLVLAVLVGLWLALRQPETLPIEKRHDFSASELLASAVEVVRHPVSLGYTIAVGGIFGGFTTYLGASEQVFVGQYDQGKAFALWFAGLCLPMIVAQIYNGKRVMQLGMLRIARFGVYGLIINSLAMLVLTAIYAGQPPLWTVGLFLAISFFMNGLQFGNYGALSMEPMGHIAGMASAITGSLSSILAFLIGVVGARQYDGTFYIFAIMFLASGLWALGWSLWAERGRIRVQSGKR